MPGFYDEEKKHAKVLCAKAKIGTPTGMDDKIFTANSYALFIPTG